MHRSRLSVFVIFAAASAAACSKRDASTEGTDLLSQDRALVARLEVDQETRQLPLPAACGKVVIPAQPAVANKNQAEELTKQSHDAEMHGNVAEARSLLSRASELDATNKSAAYHLGRTSEMLGDSKAAMTAYCRYLALTPTTSESLEARQRVAHLSQSVTRVAAGTVVDTVPSRQSARTVSSVASAPAPVRRVARVTREQHPAAPRVVANATVEQSARATSPARSTGSTIAAASGAAASGATDSPTRGEPVSAAPVTTSPAANAPVASAPEAGGTTEGAASGSATVATQNPAPAAEEPPSTAPRSTSRRASRTQGAGIGAAAGAIIGVMSGRSVKSAVIGAAAGGVLGGVVGPSVLPAPRGIAP